MFESTLLLLFPSAMIFAAIMDLFTMTIPNRLSLALVAGFAIAAPFSGLSLEAIGFHMLTGLGMLALGIFMFWRRWIGGGDAKLLAATSLWIGYDLFFPYLVYVAIVGGLLSLAILWYRGFVPEIWVARSKWALRLHERGGDIPYGIAIAAAAIWIYPKTGWFIGLSASGF